MERHTHCLHATRWGLAPVRHTGKTNNPLHASVHDTLAHVTNRTSPRWLSDGFADEYPEFGHDLVLAAVAGGETERRSVMTKVHLT
jgi:hypothetical protein